MKALVERRMEGHQEVKMLQPSEPLHECSTTISREISITQVQHSPAVDCCGVPEVRMVTPVPQSFTARLHTLGTASL